MTALPTWFCFRRKYAVGLSVSLMLAIAALAWVVKRAKPVDQVAVCNALLLGWGDGMTHEDSDVTEAIRYLEGLGPELWPALELELRVRENPLLDPMREWLARRPNSPFRFCPATLRCNAALRSIVDLAPAHPETIRLELAIQCLLADPDSGLDAAATLAALTRVRVR